MNNIENNNIANNTGNSIAIIACLKCEELYVKEWIDWHIKCGVDHFYLCDNNDVDYTPKLNDVLKEYVDLGIVEIFDYHGVHPIQPICYDDIYQLYGDLYDWYLVIDIDEFICLPKFNNDIKKYIETIPDFVYRISISWRYYGDNDLVYYDERPVQERFTKPVTKDNWIYNGQSKMLKSMIRSKHFFIDAIRITSQHALFGNKNIQSLYDKYNVLFGKFNAKYSSSIDNSHDANQFNQYNQYFNDVYNVFYIKHFCTKTAEEYCWRINRGDTLLNKDNQNYPYKPYKFFSFNERTPEKEKIFNKLLNN